VVEHLFRRHPQLAPARGDLQPALAVAVIPFGEILRADLDEVAVVGEVHEAAPVLCATKTLRTGQIAVQIGVFYRVELPIDDREGLAQFRADVGEEPGGFFVKAIALLLSPRAGVGWIIPVQRGVMPFGQPAASFERARC
jgi:hypothetical protein